MLQLLTLLLASSLTVMAGAALAPDLPQIQAVFADEPRSLFWVKLMLTLPGLFTALGAPLAGLIADRIGRKPLLIVSSLLYGLGGSSGLYLSSLSGLLLGRALLGLAVGGVMTAATALIADYYQGSRRNQVMGIQAAFMGFGGVVFLVLSGILADGSWRLPFLIYLTAFGVAAMAWRCLVEVLPRSPQGKGRAGAIAPPLATQLGWQLAGIYLLVFLSMATFYLVPVQLPFYLTTLTTGPTSHAATGIAIGALNLTSALVSTRYRWFKQRFAFGTISALGFLAMAVGYGIMAAATTYGWVLVGLIVAGVAMGLNTPNLNVWVNAISPTPLRGRIVGGLTTSLFLGQFMSPILSQPVTRGVGLAATYGWCGVLVAGVAAGTLLVQAAPDHPQG